ncbi:MAG: cobalt-precorrin-8 methylmutase [Cellulosilyticaceae bacterium]
MASYIKDPTGIERRSFEIISGIIRETRGDYDFGSDVQEKIIKRVIHTTADFEYLDILMFSQDVIPKLQKALHEGATIYTDTQMVLSGINKKRLEEWDVSVHCLVGEEAVRTYANTHQMTRSMAAVIEAARAPGTKIFVFGNAPTGLFKLIELYDAGEVDVAGVIGVPVGFVGAAESKMALTHTDLPYIVSKGRKGGSNVAAAMINALVYAL